MIVKDIEPFYTDGLKCQGCENELTFTDFDKFSDKNGDHFLVKRYFCNQCNKPIWVEPEPKERLYLDGEKEATLKELGDVITSLSTLASDMERIGKAGDNWELMKDFWGFREDFADAIKAKYRLLYEYQKSKGMISE